MKAHLNTLSSYAASLNRRRSILGLFCAVSGWSAGLLALSAWNHWVQPLQESSAAWLAALLTVVATGGGLGWLFGRDRWLPRLTARSLANRIEQRYPRLREVLITAAQIAERESAGNLPNPLEAHVLDQARSQLEAIDWRCAAEHPLERRQSLIAGSLIALLLLLASLPSVAVTKALLALQDTFAGQSSGLLLEPGDAEVAVRGDLTISASIRRWEQTAWMEWREAGNFRREPIVVQDDATGNFTFYRVEQPLAYRVVTPSLRTPWFTVETYIPPAIESVAIRVQPPRYTRREALQLERLQALEVPEGSRVTIDLQTAGSAAAQLRLAGAQLAFAANEPGRFTLNWKPTDNDNFAIELSSGDGRRLRTVDFPVRILPDRPPSVEILQPRRDAILEPDDLLGLELYAADDYGLAEGRVQISVSGRPNAPMELPFHETAERAAREAAGANADQTADSEPAGLLLLREVELRSAIELAQLKVTDGDVVAIFVEVADNREPEPNWTRSDLVFVEIRVPVEPEEADGMPAETQEIDLRALISEQKRLLRETHRALNLPEARRDQQIPVLAADLGALATEISRVYLKIREDLLGAGRRDLADLFESSLAHVLEAARQIANNRNLAVTVAPQTAAISDLLRIENALRQNTFSNEPSESESSEGGMGQGKSSSDDSDERGEDAAAQLAQSLERLRELIQQQNALNTQYERAARSNWSQAQAAAAAQAQQQAAAAVGEVDNALRRIIETQAARAAIQDARAHMQAAGSAAGERDPGAALRGGLRGREALRSAEAALQGMLADLAAQELGSAARAAARMAEQQSAAAQASSEAAGGADADGEQLENAQRELNQRYEQLLQQMRERAGELAGRDPQVGAALREAAQAAGNRRTDARMERAANALLYEQFDLAADLQESAAVDLARLAEDLNAARESLAMDPSRRADALGRELGNTLEELASYARNPDGPPGARLEQIQRAWDRNFRELEQLTGERDFGGLANAIAGLQRGEASGQLAETRALLQQGGRLLQEFLLGSAIQSSLQLNREAAPPPERYRRQVEAYFRRLAADPEAP